MRARTIILSTLLAAAIGGFLWWGLDRPASSDHSETTSDSAQVQQAKRTSGTVAVAEERQPLESHRGSGISRPPPAATDKPVAAIYAAGTRIEFTGALVAHEFGRQAGNHLMAHLSPADIPPLLAEAEAGDGEAAYLLYQFYSRCSSAPGSTEELEQWEDAMIDATAQDKKAEEKLLQSLQTYHTLLELCRAVQEDRQDMQLLAYGALQRSALLGYLPGILEYVQTGYYLITDRILRNPDLLWEHRTNAVGVLQRAVESGHPAALMARAHLAQSGRFDDPDPVEAYGYARAARLVSADLAERIDPFLTAVGSGLDPAQMRQARELARALCERHCR